jgi:hypothetical protein
MNGDEEISLYLRRFVHSFEINEMTMTSKIRRKKMLTRISAFPFFVITSLQPLISSLPLRSSRSP